MLDGDTMFAHRAVLICTQQWHTFPKCRIRHAVVNMPPFQGDGAKNSSCIMFVSSCLCGIIRLMLILKNIRIGIACVVIMLWVVVFVGGENIPPLLSRPLLFSQFIPSFLNCFLAVGSGISGGFLVILVLTVVFGRVYCACFCPTGILQDGVHSLAERFLKRRRRTISTYRKPVPFMRYAVLGVTLFSSIAGSLVVLNLLEPYSLFGRITTHLLRPVVFWVNNEIVAVLELFDLYMLARLPQSTIFRTVFWLTCIFFCGLLGVSAFRGRLYCNTICPVGTLLGIASRFSLLRIEIRQETCTSCRRCEQVCPAECINAAEHRIDESRCTRCFECLAVCPEHAIEYHIARHPQRPEFVDAGRRTLLFRSASAAGVLILLGTPVRVLSKQLLQPHRSTPATPPGSRDVEHFAAFCTACHLCVSVCPSRVIQPAFMEYGLQGIMQPVMDYRKGYCHYDCHACGQVCPTGAILTLALAEKQLTQIGQVELMKDRCLVYERGEDCGACAEVCPTHAVYTVEKNTILYPETTLELCIGCGGCEFVCPQEPKAIVVHGNLVHATAKEPFYDQEPLEVPVQEGTEEDFPF